MSKSLVIVESPSKAKIINKYLGDNYIVKASVGHIRDLPVSASGTTSKSKTKTDKNSLINKLGVDPEHNWKANYQIMPGKEKVVKELKTLAKDAEHIYLATDLDREGEAIAWHLKEVLGGDEKRYWRVKYPEITKSAIEKAFLHPSSINMDLVNAQQTRRFLDRVVGFMVSPLLWVKVARGLSAGRVQSVAVKLIVNREREIKAHKPKEYWSVDVLTKTTNKENLKLSLTTNNGKKIEIGNATEAQNLENIIRTNDILVQKVESKKGQLHAPPPFTTSTLQQAANQRLGFSVKRTMTVAQRLYESGLITYMRTDSVNLSEDAIKAAREMISSTYGNNYLPEKPNYYHSKETAQEAHEAIRPSYANLLPNALPATVDRDGERLYRLIYDRYIACQMAPMLYETTSVQAMCDTLGLRATGRVILFDGFRKIYPSNDKDEGILPKISQGEKLNLEDVIKEQHFTHPPARYSEASLVKELEKDGIGRPSTYASIIATIVDRGYVIIESGRFYATKMGEIVTDRLEYSFSNLMDTTFTASMEENLDEIAKGKADWIRSLNSFYHDFVISLDKAKQSPEDGGMPENKTIVIDMMCPQCGKYKMSVHSGKTGTFLACLGYFDKSVPLKERCKKTLNLKEIDLLQNQKNISESEEAEILRHKKRCPKCDAIMDEFLIDEHHKLYLCSKSPSCEGYLLEEGDFSDLIETGPTIECEKCGSTMILKEGRFGKYMSCTNEQCKNTRKILKNGEVAPPKEDAVDLPELPCAHEGSHFVLRDGASGIFLAAHNFPKVRETRAPLVMELKRFRDRISPKFYYLADAPEFDDDGNPSIVRFSRKLKKQYVMTAVDNKPTGWSAFYNEQTGSWDVVNDKKSTSSKGKTTTRKTNSKSTKKAK